MPGYLFQSPVFKTKVLTYEALAYRTKDTWVRYYRLFEDPDILKSDLKHYKKCRNVRNAEVYDVIIDLSKPLEQQILPIMTCAGCGNEIERGRQLVEVNGEFYCCYDCYCNKSQN